jgi:hypothetical protein
MIVYPTPDQNLIKRLNSVKPSIKKKLFSLDPVDLFLLPLRKNKVFPIFDKGGAVIEERLSIIKDILTAKISDLVFYRDLSFKQIVQEGLLLKDNDYIRHNGPFTNEYDFDKSLLDRKNFPEELDNVIKKGCLLDYLRTNDIPKQKQKSQSFLEKNGVYDPLKKLNSLRDLFDNNKRLNSADSSIVNRLRTVVVKTQFEAFPSNNWVYGIRRLKTKQSILRNFVAKIIIGLKNNPSEWNLSHNLHSFPLEDLAGMWFISKEAIDLRDYSSFKKTKISQLKNYIFKESLFNVAEGDYINKYKDPKSKSKSLRLYITPKESFFKKTPFMNLSYLNYVEGFESGYLKATVHLQDAYYAFMNKFYGDYSHYTYQSRKDIKNMDQLHELSRQKRQKVLDYKYRMDILLDSLDSFF